MKISYWGTRGSIATITHQTQFYGGHTPCVAVGQGNDLLILDAGSGIIQLGDLLLTRRPLNIHILLTHLHMDHIQGLGFFKPFFQPGLTLHIWGPQGNSPLKQRLNRYLSPPLFPVRIRDFDCKLEIFETPLEAFEIGTFQIQARHICHPGPTLGYRVTNGTSTLAYLPDHEPALGARAFPGDPEWTSGYSLAREVDVLIHDAQFTEEEYRERQGWGHSSYEQAIKFARLAQVKRLELFHHDPKHTDEQLDALFASIEPQPFEIHLAREGNSIELP
ncbi:MAG: MBL fold metallo-hydrolase [Saprospiraceae bacterium]|nr:MBL fold metallo-hydrolase [Saprospiraceae bacterium]